MTFYALRAEPGRLPVVRQILRRQGQECYLPAEIRMNHRRRKRIVVPIMPYLFVKAPDHPELVALWLHEVKATRYAKDFVKMDGKAAPVHDVCLMMLRKAIKDMRFEADAARAKRKIRPGVKAIVKTGPFRGFKGEVTWTKGRRAKWETILFGRPVEIQVDTKELEIDQKDLEAA